MDFWDRVKNLYIKFYEEMAAECAWMGHEFAADYLKDLENELKTLVYEAIKMNFKSKSDYALKSILFDLQSDYSVLISNVFATNWKESEKDTVAKALDAQYKIALEKSFGTMIMFWEQETGKSADSIFGGEA